MKIVKKHLFAYANSWARSNIGSNTEEFELLGAISVKSTDSSYYEALSEQIARYFKSGRGRTELQGGAIPLLDAYYYYSQASMHDLKSPEEFLRACDLLTEANVKQNGVFVKIVDGHKVLAGGMFSVISLLLNLLLMMYNKCTILFIRLVSFHFAFSHVQNPPPANRLLKPFWKKLPVEVPSVVTISSRYWASHLLCVMR